MLTRLDSSIATDTDRKMIRVLAKADLAANYGTGVGPNRKAEMKCEGG